ncbi:DUF1697 domain-containing protein [Occultella glacieicola]|uniref:DUF1697 domain-containing protein n=1 Tax=Occultella glacieicola TaxID=2518684 RepID=A0ABY2EBZ2_9MICO|nr:DUF1697 domain-containing protein [Occultella glacieicola]TDE97344.1 DUF1697 domain-containing protein [Occultella glacieicola]
MPAKPTESHPARYVVLLRGVNVGGINITMADLRKVLEEAGLTEVRTVLASGNALVTSDRSAAQLRPVIEAALRTAFGYEAWVQVLTVERIAAIVADYPFDTDEETHHPYVMFCADAPALAEVGGLADGVDPAVEQVRPGDGVVYWEAPKGSSTDTAFAKLTSRARYRSILTTRNLRTLRKLI